MQIDKLINAINNLNRDSKPKWGRMNSSQMLWHCNKFVIFYLNEKKYSPNYKTYIFGSLHFFFLKYILRWNYEKYLINALHGKVDNWTLKEVVRGHTAFHLNQFGVY